MSGQSCKTSRNPCKKERRVKPGIRNNDNCGIQLSGLDLHLQGRRSALACKQKLPGISMMEKRLIEVLFAALITGKNAGSGCN
jgi:hypothetical protein